MAPPPAPGDLPPPGAGGLGSAGSRSPVGPPGAARPEASPGIVRSDDLDTAASASLRPCHGLAFKIPDEVLQAVRERADIVAVVSDVVELRRAGVSMKGLCPFHQEKTPSFTVSAARGTYHCFGCDVHGDAIGFVRETRNIGFVEALRYLGDRFGVAIPEVEMSAEEAAADKERRERREWLLKANLLAAEAYEAALARPEGQAGREYLQRRGIVAEIVQSFRLGYADPDWDSLTRELARHRVPEKIVVEAGLARPRQGGGLYDFFRHRLITPVGDHLGRVVAFGARALAAEDEARAKYVNSPESAVFKKGRTLYGLDQARKAIRHTGRAVLVEGNFDVLSLHQAGFKETVASLGTALTADQVALLHRQTEEVVLLYDGDSAGQKSALKAAPLFAAEGLEFRVAALPSGQDPDDFVREEGAEALGELLAGGMSGVEWAIRTIVPERSAAPERKERAVEAVGRLAARLSSRIARTEYRALTADLLGRLGPRDDQASHRRRRASDRPAFSGGGPGDAHPAAESSTGAEGPGGARGLRHPRRRQRARRRAVRRQVGRAPGRQGDAQGGRGAAEGGGSWFGRSGVGGFGFLGRRRARGGESGSPRSASPAARVAAGGFGVHRGQPARKP